MRCQTKELGIEIYKPNLIIIAAIAVLISSSIELSAKRSKQSSHEILKQAARSMHAPNSSPVRRIDRDVNKKKHKYSGYSIRTIDGSNNNILNTYNNPKLPVLILGIAGLGFDEAKVMGNFMLDD